MDRYLFDLIFEFTHYFKNQCFKKFRKLVFKNHLSENLFYRELNYLDCFCLKKKQNFSFIFLI